MALSRPRKHSIHASEAPSGGAEEKIAFIVDSCCDLPQSIIDTHPVYPVSTVLNYSDGSFRDRIEITPEEVYRRFETEIPTTSTPTSADVYEIFTKISDAGFTHVIGITISSGLSSTFNLIRSVAAEFVGLKTAMIDTLNIGFACGMIAEYGIDLYDQGASFDQVIEETEAIVPDTHIIIIPDTLEYLYKGGRIGKTVYQLGSMLNLRPIITCDKAGKYVVAGKARGREKSIKKGIELAQKHIVPGRPYRVGFAQGHAKEEFGRLLADARKFFPDAKQVVDGGDLSPALVVHTGPKLIGIVLQVLPA